MLKRHVHTGTCLRCLPIFVGGHSGVMFEKAHKVLRVFKAEPRTDLLNCQSVVVQKLFGSSQQPIVDEVLGRSSGFSFHQLTEVARCQATPLFQLCCGCTLSASRQIVSLRCG